MVRTGGIRRRNVCRTVTIPHIITQGRVCLILLKLWWSGTRLLSASPWALPTLNSIGHLLKPWQVLVVSRSWLRQIAFILLRSSSCLVAGNDLSLAWMLRSGCLCRCWGGRSRRLVVGLIAFGWSSRCLVYVLAVKHGVAELRLHDRGRQIGLDAILDDRKLENGINCGSTALRNLEALSDEVAQALAEVCRDGGEGAADDFHGEHVETGCIEWWSQCCHLIEHDAH